MLYAFTWTIVFTLLALWSLAAWALHAAGTWTATNAGALTGAASSVELRLPDWLAPWVPPEIAQSFTSLLSGLGPLVDNLLQAAPALASGLTVATWVVWGIGSVLLVALGAGAHLLIAVWQRRGGGGGGSGPRSARTLSAG